jgi:tetratricopeptide (TPR) repeat protein
MATALGGDLIQSTAYYQQAVTLFRELGDRRGVATCLASMLSSWDYLTETMVSGGAEGADCVREGEMALDITREIHWRPGEAFTLFSLGFCMGRHGNYARALRHAQAALDIAEEIAHRQWMTGAHCALGALYLDLLALPAARQHLEQALSLARETASLFWIRSVTGFLASAYVLQGELTLAETVLNAALDPDTPFQAMGQRVAWCARGELALASGDAGLALQIADRLIASAVNLFPDRVIPRLAKLRGQALAELGRTEDAAHELESAKQAARAQGSQPLLWRIHMALGDLYQATSRGEEAQREFAAARTIIGELAESIPDVALRDAFLRRAAMR